MKRAVLYLVLVVALAGCQLSTPARPYPNGLRIYRLDQADRSEVQFRLLDAVNLLRVTAQAPALTLDSGLIAAASTHARDMAVQNRPWHFGSDGSSPIDRARRAGYRGAVLGENISETYESELETLRAWMARPDTRAVILDPNGRELGLGYFQEEEGKIWWVLMVGDSRQTAIGPRG